VKKSACRKYSNDAHNLVQQRKKTLLILSFRDSVKMTITEAKDMMGRQDDRQQSLFYDFCLEEHVRKIIYYAGSRPYWT
jgi:hypothetical protein